MTKSRKNHRQGQTTEDLAKPAWARDEMESEEPTGKKAGRHENKAEVRAQEGAAVRDFVSGQVADKLAKLKGELEKQSADNAPKLSTSHKPQVIGSKAGKRQGNREVNDEASFLDLFDPKDDENEDFAQLFNSSKQNWKEYK